MTSGQVTAWDIRVTSDDHAKIFLGLPKIPSKASSGQNTTGWAKMDIQPESVPLVVALLQSDYVLYESGSLQNAEITT
jgi:hypothetical protein